MALTEGDKKFIDSILTAKVQEEIKEIVDEMQAIYLLTEEGELHRPWMSHAEKFMGFTFSHTKQLVNHSITLTNLTRRLKWLTVGLLVLTLGNIFIILNDTCGWL
ncbi:hypothetical protein ACFLVX_02880 [Chloroflexota bacterium]